jgi:HPt (histidine-containing phosphotransfer) domain-containing protein
MIIFFIFENIIHPFLKEETMSESRLTNLTYLREITGGEPEIMKEFIQMFFDQIPEFRNGLTKHLADQKWKELGELAHKAKSSVMTFGMNNLGYQLKELQLKTQKLEDIDSYRKYVDNFIAEITQAENELNDDLSKM